MSARKLYHTRGEKGKKRREMVSFFGYRQQKLILNLTDQHMVEEQPALPRYDQDALVRDHNYLHADPEGLFEQLRQACERFATLVEGIPTSALTFSHNFSVLGKVP
jgi:hypothetical protein